MKDPKYRIELPQVNNNGTSRDELVQQRLAARAAVSAAIDALRQAAPHGRDYQTVARSRFDSARLLYRDRMSLLTDLWAELEAEAYAIQEQGK